LADAQRFAEAAVSFLEEAKQEPWRFDFFTTMRRLERTYKDRPRISDSASLREEYVSLGQDPYLDFPASNLSRVEKTGNGRLRVLVKFLGLLGPQGALPLATTEEAYGWNVMRDDAFARFLDLLNNRFIQLFFRAWADARPVAQHDRPKDDRFVTYIGATIGVGSLPYQALDSIPDAAKLAFAGLIGAKAKGASRLRSLVGGLFGVTVEIEEFVGSYLALDEADRSRVGQRNSGLGTSLLMGASVFSVQDKFRVRIYTKDMEEYLSFMPTGGSCEPLTDLVFFYIGDELDWEVELAIPAGKVRPVELSKFGQLGWSTWMSPNWTATDPYRRDARFHPMEILKQKRKKSSRR
jgi:type VI secretion system protein ImpH